MLTILDKLMGKNNGYVSSVQLFDYVRAEMQMFLNDNALCDERSVYYLAKHFFTKLDWKGQHYVFTSGTHISKAGKEVLQTNMDVITKYAKDSGGFFAYDDLVQYLERVGIKTGNLRGQMQIGVKPLFFYYSSVDLVLVESMHIDQAWLEQAARALKRLFADVGDHIVIRSILPIWYEQLPTLPSYRQWTPLLFQYVLKFYGKQLGARTIGSQLNQRYDILHSMIVCDDSEIQTFGDAVIAYIVDSNIEQRHFEAEELRHTLVNGGFIAGNELIWHMQKAIGKDPRFSWDVTGDNVSIKV